MTDDRKSVDTVPVLESLAMIQHGMKVLDVGCFRGYWADTFQDKGYDIDYLGLDVSLAHTTVNANRFKGTKFCFQHLDVFNATYNAFGRMHATDVTFPVEDASIDLIICHSLFTHLGKFANASHYMDEIKRVLKPDGYLWITFFISPPNIQDDNSYRTARTVLTALEVEELIGTFTKLYEKKAESTDYNDQTMYGLRK